MAAQPLYIAAIKLMMYISVKQPYLSYPVPKRSSLIPVPLPPALPGDNPTAESGRIVGSIPHRQPLEPSYYHSFGITTNYFVFVQQPLLLQVKKMIQLKLMKKPVVDAIVTRPEQGVSWSDL